MHLKTHFGITFFLGNFNRLYKWAISLPQYTDPHLPSIVNKVYRLYFLATFTNQICIYMLTMFANLPNIT